MKYINAQEVLPEELLKEIKGYVDGVYIYIPRNENSRKKWGTNTKLSIELSYRNSRIYDAYLKGFTVDEMSQQYFLSTQSIRRIIRVEKQASERKLMMLQEVLNHWGIKGKIKQISLHEWSVDDQYNLIEYDHEHQVKKNQTIIQTLDEQNIPVPKLIPLKNHLYYLRHENKFYMLTSLLKGNVVDVKSCDAAWFTHFGQVLADLQIAFKACEDKIEYWNNNLILEMKGWVIEDLKKYKTDYLDFEDIEASISDLEEVSPLLERQMIHRNVHLGNFLFDNNQFSGYKNFDLSQSNIRIFDICYFVLGLLSGGNLNTMSLKSWLNLTGHVVSGYDEKMKLSKVEKDAIPCVMKNIELLFVAYFLGKDDLEMAKEAYDIYEFVRSNEERILNKL